MNSKIKKYIAIATICLFTTGVSAQKQLKIGDRFIAPGQVKLMRSLENTIDWKSLEDKVVILDFFATSCGTCIQLLPKLKKIQDELSDKVKIFIVTSQDKATMDNFFSKNSFLKENEVDLPVIFSDNYLKSLFPHNSIPHEVLLFNGKVQAITSSDFINKENILKLYLDEKIVLPLKDDYGKANLLSSSHYENYFKAGVLFSGYQNGVPYQTWKFEKDSINGLYRTSFYNGSVYSALLGLAANVKMKKTIYIPRMDRVIWKVKDRSKYHDFESLGEKWLALNAISYERYDSKQRTDSLQATIILDDFENFLGLRVFVSTEKLDCLILNPCPTLPFANEKGKPTMQYSNSTVFAGFTDLSEQFPPIVDNVQYTGRMNIYAYKNLDELNQQLAQYGIKATLGKEEIEVLVIEEVDR